MKEKEVTYYTAVATGHATQVKAEVEKALGIKGNLVRLSSGLIDNRAVAVAALSVLLRVINAMVVIVGYRFLGGNMFGQSPQGLRMITSSFSSPPAQPLRQRLAEVALLFLKLGLTAFGGPAALL